MRQPIGRWGSRGACSVCVGCALCNDGGGLADEVVLNTAGHQVHHVTCNVTVSHTGKTLFPTIHHISDQLLAMTWIIIGKRPAPLHSVIKPLKTNLCFLK